ncbi:MAG: PQQ-binding-like beta-propeller repeat protein [Planctomycetaceae bacterium]|nr:PQQ-binding-like beta-propeller repeat protein [Planctomycetaceae bacterium]
MKVIKFPLLGSALAGLLGLGILAGCGDGKTEPKFTMPENPSPWRADLTPRTTGSGPSAVAGAVTEDDKPQPNFGVTGVSLPAGSGEGSEPSKVAPPDRQTVEWAMWGGAPDRNMVSATQGITLDFDLEEKRLLWTANLGSQTYGNPIYAGGKVLVGSNNGAGYRPKYPAAKDMGVLLCFDATDGKFLWQLSREKMPSGRVNDWPLQGICSAPIVEGDRLWIVTNRCEVMCLDLNGFHDGENDGDGSEVDSEINDADIIWTVDMYNELGVFPHNLAVSSPVTHGDVLYLNSGNGVDEGHLEIPAPRAASFLGLNKNTGEVVFEDNSPEDGILHGQWSSPCIGVVNGKAQVVFAAGNGWMYSFDTETHELLWKFDLNPKENLYELGGAGTRCYIIGTPVFYDNSVFLAVGQDPEHGEGVGHLWRVDATKSGDISAELGEIGAPGEPNPNSGVIWHYGGVDEEREPIYRRTMSTVAIHGGLVFAADLSGFLHCLDVKTGQRYWQHDLMAALWGSPLYLDGHIFLGDEDGRLSIFDASMEFALKRQELEKQVAEKRKAMKESEDDEEVRRLRAEIKAMIATVAPEVRESPNSSSIYTTPTVASGVMYISDRSKLYAIQITKQ